MVNYWIWPVDEENWEIAKRDLCWATYSEIATKRVKQGDEIVLYVVGRGVFKGVFRLESGWYITKELRWADELREGKKKYPYEIKLSTVELGEVNIEQLKDKLTFLNVEYPWLRLRGVHGLPANNGRPISNQDYGLILQGMRAIKAPPLGSSTESCRKTKS